MGQQTGVVQECTPHFSTGAKAGIKSDLLNGQICFIHEGPGLAEMGQNDDFMNRLVQEMLKFPLQGPFTDADVIRNFTHLQRFMAV